MGRIVREAKVPSEPEALVRFFAQLGAVATRIGLEAGPLSQWLHAGLTKAGFETVLLETRQVKAAIAKCKRVLVGAGEELPDEAPPTLRPPAEAAVAAAVAAPCPRTTSPPRSRPTG